MKKDEIRELLKHHGTPCVSIVVPAHHISNDRRTDPRTLYNAAETAKRLISENYSKASFLQDLAAKIDNAVEQIDYLHTVNGIGIYISPAEARLIHFTTPVKEKVIIGHSFDSRDLLCELEALEDYFVLAMSRKYIRLYKGEGEHLQEIQDGNFPFVYEETFEYAKPAVGNSFGDNSLKSPERDKSVMTEVRMQEFIRHADNACDGYLRSPIPLIISGDAKALSDFAQVSRHAGRVSGKVAGSYFDAQKQLAHLACSVLQDIRNREKAKLADRAHELIGKQKVSVGIEEVRRSALDGLGMQLLVENDLAYPESRGNHEIEVSSTNNPVDLIIKSVTAKNGEVVFLESGALKDFSGIALILRYNDR